ncbi:MAG: diphthamide biosynthesis enzyme Dph2 [Candidatus Anstonellaceae archaeon]
MRILLQFPEGLKAEALKEAKRLSSRGHEVFISASPCFGGCDVCLDEAKHIGAEKIIHFGHAEFCKVKGEIKVEYRPYFLEVDWEGLEGALKKLEGLLKEASAKRVALVFPIQHLKNAPILRKRLQALGFEVVIKKGKKHVKHAGQILGCDTTAAQIGGVDAVVYFGGGRFHPTGIESNARVFCLNPHVNDAYEITGEIEKLQKRKKGAILAASQAKVFGILVSTKIGQKNLAGALLAKKLLEKKGRQAAILVANEFLPSALQNFKSFEAYINTACPRIDEDIEAYGKPIVNLEDLKKLLELML